MELGPYILDEQVGSGAAADVWAGWHVTREQPVAVKLFTRHAGDGELDAFFHELRTVASLTHPGIVQLFDYGQAFFELEDRQVPYMVTELARGGTLGTGWRPGTFSDVRRTLQGILDALAHAHARGVIHRDLKPGNVLRAEATPNADLKVADFGVARLAPLGERSYADGLVAGTPKFMAPEQVRAEWRDHGPWTDLYAVGCIAWMMVTGRPLFAGERDEVYRQQLHGKLPPFEPIVSVPDEFFEWLRWLLQKDIALRCERAADASMELLALPVLDDPATIEVSTFIDELSALGSDEFLVSSLDRSMPERVERLRQRASTDLALTRKTRDHELRLWGLRRVPLIGRRSERSVLWDTLHDSFDSETPQLAVIEGPAGTGKSTLARWLIERSHELGLAEPMLVIHDLFTHKHDGLRGMLSRLFRVEGLGSAESTARIKQRLSRHMPIPHALTYAGVISEWIESSHDETSSSFEAEERADALIAVFKAFGETRVPLILVEDCERASGSLRVLSHTLRRATAGLRLVVVTARGGGPRVDSALDEFGSLCTRHDVRLDELTADEARELLDSMLPLSPALRDEIIAQTTGNPFFAVQIVGALIARDELVRNESEQFEARDAKIATATFSALIDMQIEALAQQFGASSETIEHQLELAAVLGHSVRRVEWLLVCGADGSPPNGGFVDALVRAGLVVPVGEHWAFVHELIREELISRARDGGRWERWNTLCVEMLDDLYADPDPERRAGHLLESTNWSAALDACIAAAEDTMKSDARERARRWLDRAEVALMRTDAPPDDLRRYSVTMLRQKLS